MIAQQIFKRPVFFLGFTLFLIFYMNYRNKMNMEVLSRNKLNPSSCRSATVMLAKKAPEFWQIECQQNILQINIKVPLEKQELTLSKVKSILYPAVANAFVFVANNSLIDSLERTEKVFIQVSLDENKINAFSSGKDVAAFHYIKGQEGVRAHLKTAISVQEIFKK